MKLPLKKQEKGFTIIEVLIVLAIAGLIMLIVFLAVPALQRNSRNTQRTDDASKIAAAINDCLSNRNGQITSCDSSAELNGLDTSKLSILTNLKAPTGSGKTLTAVSGTTTDEVAWAFRTQCTSDNSNSSAATNDRSAALVYNVETAAGQTLKCLSI